MAGLLDLVNPGLPRHGLHAHLKDMVGLSSAPPIHDCIESDYGLHVSATHFYRDLDTLHICVEGRHKDDDPSLHSIDMVQGLDHDTDCYGVGLYVGISFGDEGIARWLHYYNLS